MKKSDPYGTPQQYGMNKGRPNVKLPPLRQSQPDTVPKSADNEAFKQENESIQPSQQDFDADHEGENSTIDQNDAQLKSAGGNYIEQSVLEDPREEEEDDEIISPA